MRIISNSFFRKDSAFFDIVFNAIFFKILTVIILFVSNILISRGLSPEGRAEFYLILTLINTVASFSYLGFPTSNIYFISSNKGSLGTHFSQSIVLSCLGGLVMVIYGLFKESVTTFVFIFSIFYTIISMLSLFLGGIFISIQKEKKFFIGELLTPILMVIFYSIFWMLKLNYRFYLIGNLVSILGSVFYFIFHLQKSNHIKFDFNLDMFLDKLKFSSKVYLTTVASFLISKGSIFLVANYCSKNEVGNYSLVIQLVDAITLVPVTIGTYLFPKLVRQELGDRWKIMIKTLILTLILMVFVGILIYFLSDQFIIAIFGIDYSQTSQMLKVFIPGFILISLSSIISQYLASNNYPISMVYIWLTVLIISFIASYFLIPLYGAKGNVISLSISYTFLVFLMLILSNNIRKKNVSSFS
jgi:O-antigen/teichoic acid export membrane protein